MAAGSWWSPATSGGGGERGGGGGVTGGGGGGLLALLLLLTSTAWTTVAAHTQHNRGYLIAVPSIIVTKAPARVCTTFHDVRDDVTITFKVRCTKRKTTYTQIESFPNGADRCINLEIPAFINKARAEISASVSLASASASENPPIYRKEVRVVADDYFLIFIQTDKPLYRPGQTVKIRILSVTLDLRPKTENLDLIYLEDPDGYRLMEWRDVPCNVGLAEVEFPLAKDTPLGDWKLMVQSEAIQERRYFTVAHYVLPDFEVTVIAPRFLPVKGSSIAVRVCAKYVYGKDLSGNFTVVACSPEQRCRNHSGQLNGCIDTHVQWDTSRQSGERHDVIIYANVTDLHSGLSIMSSSQRLKPNGGRVLVDLETYSVPYFKPGIPYSGKAKLRFESGQPAGGARLDLMASIDGDLAEGRRKKRFRFSYTADYRGEVLFSLPVLTRQVDSFQIRAHASTNWADGMMLKTTEAVDMTVQRWYSPSNTYLQMETLPHLGACVTALVVNTTIVMATELSGNLRFHYQVMSGTGVMATGIFDHVISAEGASVAEPTVARAPETFTIGNDIQSRLFSDRWTNVALIPNPFEKITRPGYIVQWRMFSNRRIQNYASIYLQVWRPISDAGSEYRLVGDTLVMYNSRGEYVKALEGHERIGVRPGDVIGLYFPRKNTVPFDARDCADPPGGDKSRYARIGRSQVRKAGRKVRFNRIVRSSWIPCRQYSIKAQVEVDDSLDSKQNVVVAPRNFLLTVNLPSPAPPSSHLMLYYITAEGEAVADVLRLDAGPCFQHKVGLRLVGDAPYPGDEIRVEIGADPGSMCALGVVDRTVHAMQEADAITIDKIYRKIARKIPERETKKKECDTGLLDAQKAFEVAGLEIMTDLKVKTRPCALPPVKTGLSRRKHNKLRPHFRLIEEGRLQISASSTPLVPPADVKPDPDSLYPGVPTLKRRFYFPDTWLWETVFIGNSSKATLSRTLPHSITEWTGSTICLHSTSGLGVAPFATIRAFQPFFVSFNLPATVVRNEVLPLKVTINSYLDDCFELALRLELSDSLALVQGGIEEVICMCEQNMVSLPYKLAPLDVGTVNVTFSAAAVESRGVCQWTDARVEASDTVTKVLHVEPEGIPQEQTKTVLACSNGYDDEQSTYMNLSLPVNIVQDSQLSHITVTADVLGPTIFNVHKLLRMPTGCGEQNLAKLAVNVQVLDYLTNTGQLTNKLKRKALTFISEGYQRVLRFRRQEGSYSPFGVRDETGSMWLTAFAVRTFSAARLHTFVEEDAFRGSIAWLQQQQPASGCFTPTGMVHNKLVLGGTAPTDRQSTAVSAYIMAALLDAGLSRYSPVLMRVVHCLDGQSPTDVYSLALMSYAYSVYEPGNLKRRQCLDKLRTKAVRTGGFMYWRTSGESADPPPDVAPDPIDIEVAAYVLLALLASKNEADLIEGSAIVRWLSSQRNAHGGFASTQDTVIAVEALAKYSALTFRPEVDLVVTVDGSPIDGARQVAINTTNRLVTQKQRLVVLPASLRFVVAGHGCALIQGQVSYHVPVVVERRAHFALDVAVLAVPHPPSADPTFHCPRHHCWLRTLEVCTRYTGPHSESSMSIVSVKMVSGWVPDQTELSRNLTDHPLIHKFSVTTDSLHVYYIKMTKQHECLTVTLRQEHEVTNAQPGHVQVYDYYLAPSLRRVQTYAIEEVCTEEEKETLCIPKTTIH